MYSLISGQAISPLGYRLPPLALQREEEASGLLSGKFPVPLITSSFWEKTYYFFLFKKRKKSFSLLPLSPFSPVKRKALKRRKKKETKGYGKVPLATKCKFPRRGTSQHNGVKIAGMVSHLKIQGPCLGI